ncbi:MAG: fibronectin type III domain-containing protein, partial [Tepidisphaeraceae bacterium]
MIYDTKLEVVNDKTRRLEAVRKAIVPVVESLEARSLFSATVESFTLIDANTDQPLMTIANGATINLTTLASRDLNIRANVTGGEAASVEFNLDGTISSDTTGPNYALAGELDGDYQDWTPSKGMHSLSASAVDIDPEALDGPGLNITFTVVDRAAAPANFVATAASPTQVNLAWTDKASDETHFIIDRSTDGVTFTRLASVETNGTSYVDTTVNPSSTYYYRIKAINTTLNSKWVGAVVTTPAVARPAAPSGVTVTADGNALDLSWVDNSSNETHFILDRSTDGVTFARLASAPAGTTTFTDTLVTTDKTYHYRIKAVTTTLNSAWSTPASGSLQTPEPPLPPPPPPVETETKPAAPSDVLVETMSSTQLLVTWQDNSNNELHFLVDRSIDGVTFTRAGSVAANTGTFTDSGLSASTKYYYRVKAVGATLTSAWTPTMSGTTDVAPPAADIAVVSFTLINADTNQPIQTLGNGGTIDFGAIGTRNVNVRANTTGAAGSVKFVYDGATFRTESSAPYAMAGDSGGTFNAWTPEVGAHTLKGLAYTGADASGVLGRTLTVNFTVVEGEVVAPTAPAAPTALTAAAASSSSVSLNWADSSNNESGFRIERSSDGVNFTQVASVGVNVRTYTNTVLNSSTQYHFRVRAYNATGSSDYTNVAIATTDAPGTTPTPTPGTFPNAFNTGPTNRSILRQIGSTTITQDGAVLENFHMIGGNLIIAANNV